MKKNNTKLNTIHGMQENVGLGDFTTFGIGGQARYLLETDDMKKVASVIQIAGRNKMSLFVLGGGSNILVSDQGFDGVVIKIADTTITVSDETVTAGSGALLQSIAVTAAKHGLAGMEFCVGIPGTIGGAITGNAGTAKDWVGSRVRSVRVLNSRGVKEYSQTECGFGYRTSVFKKRKDIVITDVTLVLRKGDPTAIMKKQRTAVARRSQQPKNVLSAGSVFRNPETVPAWKLIDDAGLRGKKIGGAMVSEEHTNFIINTGTATAEDVITLISYIKQQVRDTFNIQLMEEIEYVGFD